MLDLMQKGYSGGSRAVGVSNFEKDHLMDLMPVAGPAGYATCTPRSLVIVGWRRVVVIGRPCSVNIMYP